MKKYFIGFFKYFCFSKISKFALVSCDSNVSRKTAIYQFAKINQSTIGEYSYIGPNSEITRAVIGKFCSIARNVNIGLDPHTLSHISTSPVFTEKRNGTKTSWTKNVNSAIGRRCIIGNDVWIGTRVIIKDGIIVGNGAVIGAGAIVTHDVPPYAIVAGIPAKIIRYRFDSDTIETLLNLCWWDWPESIIRQNIIFFQSPNAGVALKELQRIDKSL